MKEKPIQVFMMMKCQKKVLIVLSVISIDSVFKIGKNYYPQVFRRM